MVVGLVGHENLDLSREKGGKDCNNTKCNPDG